MTRNFTVGPIIPVDGWQSPVDCRRLMFSACCTFFPSIKYVW